ncbi:hypothetical protein H0X10_02275 [Candidatus Saccharibacteria bacterium]|nr:hypothetical protein [Candidatus Saccharibacteria bacterium]
MEQTRFTRLLLRPSAGGLIGIISLALLIMIVSGFSYTTRNNLFYDYLFGAGSSVTLIETSQSSVAVFNETVFGNATLNKILFFVFWMVIGLVVYVLLSGFGAGVSSVEHAANEAQFVHAKKLRLGSEIGLKVVLHSIGFGLLLLYSIFLFKVLLPFGVLCARIVAGNLRQPINWLYGLLGFIVLCGTLYIGLILIRFLLLRPRIFGGQEDLLEDELKHHGLNNSST